MKTFIACFLFLATASLVHAQDSLRLSSGERIFGEIRAESEKEVEFIDRSGTLRRYPRGEVTELKTGRPISRSLQKKLDEIDQNDASALLRIAEAAFESKSLKSDAQRILRRILVIEPDRARARELLGHVRALDRWFEDAEAADQAVAELMEGQGLIRVGAAWAEPEDVESVQAAPKEWMAVERRWRLVSVVMKERGYIEWSGVWYPPEEKEVIKTAKKVEDQIQMTIAGAITGETTALDVRGREQAKHMSDLIEKTRAWFAKRFDLPFIEDKPDILCVILKDKAQYENFLFNCLPIHRIREERIEEYKKNRFPITSFNSASQVHFLEDRAEDGINHMVVYDVGQRLMDFSWIGDLWFAPPWLRRAIGHHAEMAVLGAADLGLNAVVDKYGRGGSSIDSGARTLEVTKKRLAKAMKKRKYTARWLFGLERGDLTEESDDFAMIFVAWLFEVHGEGFNAFIREPDKALEMHERFARHIGLDFEKADEAFRAWLGV